MKHVSKLSNLSSLRLSNTSISDAGLVHLARLPKLQDLQLLNTKVTKNGVEALRDVLPNCEVQYFSWNEPYLEKPLQPPPDRRIYGEGAAVMKWAATLDSKGQHVTVKLDEA